MAGSPWGAWVWVWVPMWMWVNVSEALLIGRGLVMPLILIVSLIEGSITLQAIPGRRPAPAGSVRGPR